MVQLSPYDSVSVLLQDVIITSQVGVLQSFVGNATAVAS